MMPLERALAAALIAALLVSAAQAKKHVKEIYLTHLPELDHDEHEHHFDHDEEPVKCPWSTHADGDADDHQHHMQQLQQHHHKPAKYTWSNRAQEHYKRHDKKQHYKQPQQQWQAQDEPQLDAEYGHHKGPAKQADARYDILPEQHSLKHVSKHETGSNWWGWRHLVSYFPSGQEELSKRKLNLKHKFHVKAQQAQQQQQQEQHQYVSDKVVSPTPQQQLQQGQDASEFEQQLKKYAAPVAMYDDSSFGEGKQQQQKQQQIEPADQQTKQLAGAAASSSMQRASIASQRARDSLLNAANIARSLASRPANTTRPRFSRVPATSTTTTTTVPFIEAPPSLPQTTTTTETPRGVFELIVPDSRSNPTLSARDEPRFLGFGQVQRIEPFNNNGRTQARLSCQFGDESMMSNMTIYDVEWAKFAGDDYDASESPPAFECRRGSACRLERVRTDTLVTVHPRPLSQTYINMMSPSYSVTLHDVERRHLGVYRCSAMRRHALEPPELVYRIIPFNS